MDPAMVEVAVKGIDTLSGLIDKILVAYTRSQELDLEMLRVKSQTNVANSLINAQVKVLEIDYKRTREAIHSNLKVVREKLREGVVEKEFAMAPAAAAEEEPDDEFKIVRSKRFSIKPMSAEEAILQMNLLEHEFFVFRNMDADDAIAVVYKRSQGGYGLICDDGLNE